MLQIIWGRYVDGVFICWAHGMQALNEFLEELNKLDSHIKFTMEAEIEGMLPFLDVDVLRVDQSLPFNVYRKPIKLNTVIPFQSDHPFNYKISAFSSFINLPTLNRSNRPISIIHFIRFEPEIFS